MVECDLAKVEVAGSNPVSRSNTSVFLLFSLDEKIQTQQFISLQTVLPARPTRANGWGIAKKYNYYHHLPMLPS